MFNSVFTKEGWDKPTTTTNLGATGDVLFEADYSIEAENNKIDTDMVALSANMAMLDLLDALMESGEANLGKGLSPDAAAMFVNQAEAIRVSLGVPVEITTSMESFGRGLSDNIDALEVSLASIKDTLSKGWDMVINFLKDILNKIKTFFALLSDKMPGLKKRAEALKEKANDTSGTAENSKIKIGGDFARLAKTKTEVDDDLIVSSLKAVTAMKVPEELVASVSKSKLENLDADATKLASLSPSDIGFSGNSDLSMANKGVATAGTPADSWGVPQGAKAEATPLLAGMKNFVYTYKEAADPSKLDSALEAMASRKFALRDSEKSIKFENDREVPTLAPGDVVKICDAIVDFADHFEKSKGTIETARKEAEQMTKLAEKLKTNSAKSDYKDVKGILNKARSAITANAAIAANPTRDLVAYGYGVSNSALAYGSKSLSQYKG